MAEGADHPTVVFALEAGVDAVFDSNELSQHDHLSQRRTAAPRGCAPVAEATTVSDTTNDKTEGALSVTARPADVDPPQLPAERDRVPRG